MRHMELNIDCTAKRERPCCRDCPMVPNNPSGDQCHYSTLLRPVFIRHPSITRHDRFSCLFSDRYHTHDPRLDTTRDHRAGPPLPRPPQRSHCLTDMQELLQPRLPSQGHHLWRAFYLTQPFGDPRRAFTTSIAPRQKALTGRARCRPSPARTPSFSIRPNAGLGRRSSCVR